MIQGTLMINLEPPYVSFSPGDDSYRSPRQAENTWHYCSIDDIRHLLVELKAIEPTAPWHPRECILRLPVTVPKASLKKLHFRF